MGMNINQNNTPLLPLANKQQPPAQDLAAGQNPNTSIGTRWAEVNKKVADNPVGGVVTGMVGGSKESLAKILAPTAAGIAGSWVLGKGCDYLLSSSGTYEKAPFMKLVKKVDNSRIGNNFIFNTLGRVANAAKSGVSKINNLFSRNNTYKEAGNYFRQGATHKDWFSGFLGSSLLSHFDSNLVDKFKPGDLAKVLAENGKADVVLGFVNRAGSDLKGEAEKQLAGEIKDHITNNNLLNKLSNKDKALVENIIKHGKDADHSALVGKFKPTEHLGKLSGELRESLLKASLNKNTKQAAKDIAKILHDNSAKLPAGFYKVPNKIFSRFTSLFDGNFKNLADKVNTSANAKSGLSKFLSEFSVGFSEFMGSNALGILMNGAFFGMAIKEAAEAPKGEKVSTFMEDILGNWVGFMLASPYIAKLINGTANLKKIEINKASTLMKAPAALAKLTGKIVGLGMDPNLGKKHGKLGRFGIKIPATIAGGLIRVVGLFVLAGIASKPFRSLSHLIFGKPTHKEEKEKAEKAKQQAATVSPNTLNPQQFLSNPQAALTRVNTPQQARLNQLLQNPDVKNEILSRFPGMDKAQIQELMNNPQFQQLLLANLSSDAVELLGNNPQYEPRQVQNSQAFSVPDDHPKTAGELAGEILFEYNRQSSMLAPKLNPQSEISKNWQDAALF